MSEPVVGLQPRTGLCLVGSEERRRLRKGPAWAPARFDHDLATAATAQKIYFAPGTVPQYILLREAFSALGESAPTAEQARVIHTRLAADIPFYRYRRQGELWWIENTETRDFGDPFARTDWTVHVTGTTPQPGLPVDGTALADTLGVMPWLGGQHSFDEVAERVGDDPAARALLGHLSRHGALVLGERRSFDLARIPPLLFVSHSSLFVHDGQHSVLIDPLIFPRNRFLAPEGRATEDLLRHADVLVFSHNHWDHFAYDTLVRIPRGQRMVVPRVVEPTLANPPMGDYLRALGFTRVEECGPGDVVRAGEIVVRLMPFFGEPSGIDSRFDAFTYVVEFAGRRLFGSLDASADEAGRMEPVIDQVARLGPIDYFLFGSSDLRHDPLYPAARLRYYSNELITRPDLVRYHPSTHDVERWCRRLQPRLAIPYAEFVFDGVMGPDADTTALEGNFADYWTALSNCGRPIPEALPAWREALADLRASIDATLVMLHPMQGLRDA